MRFPVAGSWNPDCVAPGAEQDRTDTSANRPQTFGLSRVELNNKHYPAAVPQPPLRVEIGPHLAPPWTLASVARDLRVPAVNSALPPARRDLAPGEDIVLLRVARPRSREAAGQEPEPLHAGAKLSCGTLCPCRALRCLSTVKYTPLRCPLPSPTPTSCSEAAWPALWVQSWLCALWPRLLAMGSCFLALVTFE